MTVLQKLGQVNASIEAQGRVGEFVSAVRYLMIGNRGDAALLAEKAHAPSRVVDFCKAGQRQEL